MSESLNSKKWNAHCAIAICLVRAFWRLLFYIYDKNLWLDEAMVALNIIHRSFRGLCLPLELGQMAPLGFLWLTKACVVALGDYDLIFRLPELLASWLAILFFYKLVKEAMPDGGPGAFFALALFALNRALVEFALQVKPYEIDALASTLLLLAGARLLRCWRMDALVFFGITATIAPWFSFTSCFVFGAAGTVIALQNAIARRWKNTIMIAAATGAASLSCLANYYYFCRKPASTMMSLEMHRMAWLRLLPHDFWDLKFDCRLLLESIAYPGGFILSWVGVVLLVLGGFAFFARGNSLGALLGSTVLLGIIGSGIGKYPWNGRLVLFLVPIACLTAGFGMNFISQVMERNRFRILAVLIGLLTLVPLAYNHLVKTIHPFNHQGIETVLEKVSERAPAGSHLFIDDYSTPLFQFYDRHGKYSSRFDVIDAGLFMQDEETYRKRLAQLKGKGDVWFIFPDFYIGAMDHPNMVITTLNATGHRVDAVELFMSKAYLYRF